MTALLIVYLVGFAISMQFLTRHLAMSDDINSNLALFFIVLESAAWPLLLIFIVAAETYDGIKHHFSRSKHDPLELS